MINVTKTFLPPLEEYQAILKRAWDKEWITNNGELVLELEEKLKNYLGLKHLWFTTNGTVVLQMALKALNISGEVITTPFSYVATTNAIIWENCKPVFVDIKPGNYTIDEYQIESAITEKTQAILATHVYGLPCNVDFIETLAKRYNLKVIYDAAHAFGAVYKGQSLLNFGDISTCSFHATKVFHTVEGGCIVCNDDELAKKLYLYRSFGHLGDDYYSVGINGKNSEFHAAMGLTNLPYVSSIIADRKIIFDQYRQRLRGHIELLDYNIESLQYNFAYYPVFFKDEETLIRIRKALLDNGINARRYFYPSLNELPFQAKEFNCIVSESTSRTVLSLPLYPGLSIDEIDLICSTIINQLQ